MLNPMTNPKSEGQCVCHIGFPSPTPPVLTVSHSCKSQTATSKRHQRGNAASGIFEKFLHASAFLTLLRGSTASCTHSWSTTTKPGTDGKSSFQTSGKRDWMAEEHLQHVGRDELHLDISLISTFKLPARNSTKVLMRRLLTLKINSGK